VYGQRRAFVGRHMAEAEPFDHLLSQPLLDHRMPHHGELRMGQGALWHDLRGL
jgi:hypothetical protein